MRTCSKCGERKPIKEFYKRSRLNQRFQQCKRCFRAKQAEYKERLWNIVFGRYGKYCQCCGEVERKFLTIDHIEGRRHWKHDKAWGGYAIWLWLVKHNLPDGFQTLCWNCNLAKGLYGACPHNQ